MNVDPTVIEFIAKLATLRQGHLDQAAKLETTINNLRETFDIPLSAPSQEPKYVPYVTPDANGPYTGMTIGNAAIAFLRAAGTPQKTRDICDALRSGGLASASVNLYRTVYNTLLKRSEVEIKDAKWGLVE